MIVYIVKKWKSLSLSDSLWLRGLQSARLLSPWNSLGKNTGVGSVYMPRLILPITYRNDFICTHTHTHTPPHTHRPVLRHLAMSGNFRVVTTFGGANSMCWVKPRDKLNILLCVGLWPPSLHHDKELSSPKGEEFWRREALQAPKLWPCLRCPPFWYSSW